MHCTRLRLVDDHENIRFTFRLALKSKGRDADTTGAVAYPISDQVNLPPCK